MADLDIRAAAVPARPKPLGALTSLRFFAALAIVLHHVGSTPISKLSSSLGFAFDSGYVAVGLFYVLSGFVLAYNYWGVSINRRTFYAARFARLYPVYFLALVLALPVFLWGAHRSGEYSPVRMAASLVLVPTMLQSWMPPVALAWNGPAWSISVECLFYILFPLLIVWIGRRTARSNLWLAALMWPLAIAPSLIYVTLHADGLTVLTGIHQKSWVQAEAYGWLGIVNFSPILRLPEFVAGVALGGVFRQTRRSGTSRYGAAVALSIAAMLLAVELLPALVPYPVVHNGLLLPIWCTLLYSLASYQEGGGARLTAHPWLLLLGEASYGVYILQVPVSGYLKFALLKIGGVAIKGDYPNLALVAVYCVILCALSIVSFQWMEVPLRLWLRTKLARTHSTPQLSLTPASRAQTEAGRYHPV